MLSRSVRAETRQSRKEDIKRVMHSIDKVRQSWLSSPAFITGHLSLVSGPQLGEKMGCDSRDYNEAVQVDPRL